MLAKAKRLESTPLQIKFISPYLNIRIDIFLSQPFVLFLWYTENKDSILTSNEDFL